MEIDFESIKLALEEAGVTEEQTDEFLALLRPPSEGNTHTVVTDPRLALTLQLASETDWRKKASLAAQLVKLGLDE